MVRCIAGSKKAMGLVRAFRAYSNAGRARGLAAGCTCVFENSGTEELNAHLKIRARIEPALDDGRFARKKRCYARANNAGWRIDYFLVSERIRGCIEESSILPEVMGSDHCPVMLEMGMPE